MSKTTTIEGMSITNKESIEKAVANLRRQGIACDLVKDQVPKMYFGFQESEIGQCDYVIKMAGSRYDVGLKLENNEYKMYFDDHAGDIRNVIGIKNIAGETSSERQLGNVALFSMEYAKEYCQQEYSEGFDYAEMQHANGSSTILFEQQSLCG